MSLFPEEREKMVSIKRTNRYKHDITNKYSICWEFFWGSKLLQIANNNIWNLFKEVLKQKKAHRLNVMSSQKSLNFWFTTLMGDILGLVFFGFTDSVSSIFLKFDTITILDKTR